MVTINVKLQTILFSSPDRFSVRSSFFLNRLGIGFVDGPNILMKGVGGQHEHHNKQNNDKEENKGRFEILHLHLLQPFTATNAASFVVFNKRVKVAVKDGLTAVVCECV